ncbi:MAG: SufD family Fe-S cluster assembly protein [bacterium]|nr:SufD family Fe-S cluster assembly protein [bacterium]
MAEKYILINFRDFELKNINGVTPCSNLDVPLEVLLDHSSYCKKESFKFNSGVYNYSGQVHSIIELNNSEYISIINDKRNIIDEVEIYGDSKMLDILNPDKTVIHRFFRIKSNSSFEHSIFVKTTSFGYYYANYIIEDEGSLNIYFANEVSSGEFQIRVDVLHIGRKSTSRVYTKSVVDRGRAISIVNIFVGRTAKGTDSMQVLKSLLLTKEAKAVNMPLLEVDTNDVKAAHGSSTGKALPEQVFYLSSRGLDEHYINKLLKYAFINDVVSKSHYYEKAIDFFKLGQD